MEKSYIAQIQDEYKRIDHKWLILHYKTSVGLVLFSILIECLMVFPLYYMDEIHTTMPIYIFKYLIFPATLNLICIVIGYYVISSKGLNQNIKVYVISLLYVMICFIIFSIHSFFPSLFLIFTVPIVLTIVYSNYLLTTIVAISSITAVIIAEVFIEWDADKVNIFTSNSKLTNFIIEILILITFSGVCLIVTRFEREKNSASIQKEIERYRLQKKLYVDALTGINNRAALSTEFNNIEEDNSDNSYIFVMIDLDNFKMLNDNLGHTKGDQCLIEFGKNLKSNCLDAMPFRFGGDEFCIIFRNSSMKSVIQTCQKIQDDFKEFIVNNKIDLPLSVSFGVSQYTKDMTTARLLVNTDIALYQSKTIKNDIRIYDESMVFHPLKT